MNPTVLDSVPFAGQISLVSPNAFLYNSPGSGSNRLLICMVADAGGGTPTASYNGAALTFVGPFAGSTQNLTGYYVGYLAAPASGSNAFTLTSNGGGVYSFIYVCTLQDAAQTSPIDASIVASVASSNTKTTAITTNSGHTLLLSIPVWTSSAASISYGSGETRITSDTYNGPFNYSMGGSSKAGASSAGSESMTITIGSSNNIDLAVVAIKAAPAPLNNSGFFAAAARR